jgi:predicted esterase YcpF (UPF0227 family)
MIIYLHGFRSSPASTKAKCLKNHLSEKGLSDQFWCEELPIDPALAIERVEQTIATNPAKSVLIGSSLGGYYATYLAEKHDLRAILINPVTHAGQTLSPWIGPHTNLYTSEHFELTSGHVAALNNLWVPILSKPERFWLIVENGDEILDYREAVSRYAGARQTVIEGGDHSLRHFPDLLEAMVEFALFDKD